MRNLLWAIALSALVPFYSLGAFAAQPQRPLDGPATHSARAATAAPGESRASAGAGSFVINLNEASPAQLELLPGVGASRASAIVNYRKLHPFKHVEELQRIKGIGRKTFARLRPLLALAGPTTMTNRPVRN